MANLTIISTKEMETFRKEMSLLNVTVYDDRMVYYLRSPKIADSCAERARKIILKNSLPLEAYRPKHSHTLVIQPKID